MKYSEQFLMFMLLNTIIAYAQQRPFWMGMLGAMLVTLFTFALQAVWLWVNARVEVRWRKS